MKLMSSTYTHFDANCKFLWYFGEKLFSLWIKHSSKIVAVRYMYVQCILDYPNPHLSELTKACKFS